MTRVIAGEARGRRLAVPSGHGTRPTSDRAREGLFSTLRAMRGSLAGVRVLDLYAGSGAVGLEALSRGATEALLVESDRRAAAVLRRNVAEVGLSGARVVISDVTRLMAQQHDGDPYDVIFADPPYALSGEELAATLGRARQHGWIAADAVVVVERASRDEGFAWPPGYVADRSRRYGDATLWYGRAAGGSAESVRR